MTKHSNNGYKEPDAHIIAFYAPTWKQANTLTAKISWLSAWVTQGKYSHIGLLLDDYHLFHAYWYTRLQNIEELQLKTKWHSYDTFRIINKEYSHYRAIKIAMSMLGKPYDFKRYFGIAMFNLYRLFGKKYTRNFDWRNAYVCHEFVKAVITKAGATFKSKKTYSSPNELIDNINVIWVSSTSRTAE